MVRLCMMRSAQRLPLLALALLLLGASVARAAHVWPTLRHDLQNTGRSPYTGPTSPRVKWKFQTGGFMVGTPALAGDGTLYVGAYDNKLYAINTATGTKKWTLDIGYGLHDALSLAPDGTIYVPGNKKLLALAPSGMQKWAFSTGAANPTRSTVGPDGTIYVGDDGGTMHALSPGGQEKWSLHVGLGGGPPAFATDGTLYETVDNKVCAINAADGSIIWEYVKNFNGTTGCAVAGDGTIYAAGGNGLSGAVTAVDPSGKEVWECVIDDLGINASFAIAADGTLILATKGPDRVTAISPKGEKQWTYDTPFTSDESLMVDAAGTIYASGWTNVGDNKLIALKPDGTLKWEFVTGHYNTALPVLDAKGVIYLCSSDKFIYALEEGAAPPPPLTLAPTTVALAPGETQQFAATPAADVTWTCTGGTIDATGLYTAGTVAGDFTVTATSPNETAAATVTIATAPPPTPLTIAPTTASLKPDETQSFTADPAADVTWTCTGGTITAAGLYTAGSVAGDFTITATSPNGTATANVTIAVTPPPTPLTIDPATAGLTPGETQQFTATPAADVVWTCTGGTISATGLFTAGAVAGDFSVTATSPAGTATATVTITVPPPPTPLTIAPTAATLQTGATQSFAATPAANVAWTCTGGTISGAGLFTAGTLAGTYTVTATSPNGTATATVTVTAPPPALTIAPAAATLDPRGVQQFDATPAAGVTWTSTGGTITQTGRYTAGAVPGTYTVTATSSSGTATATITITAPPPPAPLTLTESAVSVQTGGTHQFVATPAAGVVWTCTGGSITAGGAFTAGDTPGLYRVTATSPNGTATATVTITAPPPTAPAGVGQPDLMVRSAAGGPYAGLNYYGSPEAQGCELATYALHPAAFQVALRNAERTTATFTVTGDAGSATWAVAYADGFGNDITGQLTGAGWRVTLGPGEMVTLAATVTPSETAGSYSRYRVTVRAIDEAAPQRADAVRLTAQCVPDR